MMKLRSVKELFWVLSVLGIRNLRRLSHARRWGWEGILRGHFMTRAIQALECRFAGCVAAGGDD